MGAAAKCGWQSGRPAAGVLACGMAAPAWAAAADGRSTNIALDHSGSLLFVANRLADSLTVLVEGMALVLTS